MKSDIIKIINEILEEEVTETTDRNNAKNWDSLNHIKIVLALQSKFGIKLNVDEIANTFSVNDFCNLVENKLKS